MIESASTADVLFWMIHPAIERLLAAKRLPEVGTLYTPHPCSTLPDPPPFLAQS